MKPIYQKPKPLYDRRDEQIANAFSLAIRHNNKAKYDQLALEHSRTIEAMTPNQRHALQARVDFLVQKNREG